ncbi:MAG: glycosyltransferase [Chitinivibrionales bacterium]|nr:glycosyltransferase [Chitinivibrionales bacterium]
MEQKILQIIDTSNNGGAEKHTKLIAAQFSRIGFDVYFIFPPGPFSFEFHRLSSLGLKCFEMDFRKNIITFIHSIIKIRRLIKSRGILYIHSHQYLADFMACVSTLCLKNRKKFSTIHFLLKHHECSLIKRLQMYICSLWSYHCMNYVFAVSEYARDVSKRYFLLPNLKIRTIHNGIEPLELSQDNRLAKIFSKNYNISSLDTCILCIGRLDHAKGQDVLIRAMSKYKGQKSFKLLLLGDGAQKARYQKMAENLNLSNKVIFPGYQEKIAIWYSMSHIFVHPSRHEALSRSILEAMYMKIPVIVSDIPSNKEIIKNLRTGLVYSCESDASLLSSIEFVINNPITVSQMVDKAFQVVKQNHTIHVMVQKMSKYFSIN